ncbi:MAG: ATP-binding protein [Candidatus Micrarchaeota archaeon]
MYLTREEEHDLMGLLDWKEAIALIGPRRAGKTTLALRMLDIWKSRGGEGRYLDLEAIGSPSTPADLLKEMTSLPEGGLMVLDEVQVVPGWVKAVRQEAERKKRRLMITGSSASMLSKEISSSLGGRAIPERVLTLSYRDARAWGLKSLKQYMDVGGYPECVLRPDDASRLHKLYLELTVLRDVAARKGIRETKPLSDLALLALSEPGKMLASKKTSSMLGISQPTFRSFLDALNDAYLILSVPPFMRSPRQRLVSEAKHYAYDTGLQKSVSISTEDDAGRRLENVVAIELVRRGYSLSYLKADGAECDFIAQKAGAETLAVQVWGGEGGIPERESAGLKAGMEAARAKGLVLGLENAAGVKKIDDWLLER